MPALVAAPSDVPRSDRIAETSAARATFWLLQAGGWTAYLLVLTLPWLERWSLAALLPTKLASAAVGLTSSLAVHAMLRRAVERDAPIGAQLGTALTASLVGGAAWSVVLNAVVAWTWSPHVAPFVALAPAPPARALFAGTTHHALVLLVWSALYLGLRHHRALGEARAQRVRAEALATAARLDALRYQLDPHFLFNALNALSTLVVEGRTREASRTIAQLGDLLRGTLDDRAPPLVPLADEIALVRRYLEIERIRLGARLRVRIELRAEVERLLVPRLLLQPLVENAVRHAVAPRPEGGEIRIAAARDGERLRLEVADDGPGLPAAVGHAGVGLRNVRERLRCLYGDAHEMELRGRSPAGLRVLLAIPAGDGAPALAGAVDAPARP